MVACGSAESLVISDGGGEAFKAQILVSFFFFPLFPPIFHLRDDKYKKGCKTIKECTKAD